jgi:hypothetical protein
LTSIGFEPGGHVGFSAGGQRVDDMHVATSTHSYDGQPGQPLRSTEVVVLSTLGGVQTGEAERAGNKVALGRLLHALLLGAGGAAARISDLGGDELLVVGAAKLAQTGRLQQMALSQPVGQPLGEKPGETTTRV